MKPRVKPEAEPWERQPTVAEGDEQTLHHQLLVAFRDGVDNPSLNWVEHAQPKKNLRPPQEKFDGPKCPDLYSETDVYDAMKYMGHAFFVLTLLILALPAASPVSCQTLLLRAPGNFAQGTGACSSVVVGVYSKNWRVRKGDVFEVRAVQPVRPVVALDYVWTVSNGKVLSGQGTPTIQVRAGGIKTRGYDNVTGFVAISLTVTTKSGECRVTAESSIMIGRHREVNQTPNVNELILDEELLVHPCAPGNRPREGSRVSEDMIISVKALAADPENDVLSYNYQVTGGRIVGTGANVRWDLTDAPPGTYRITVGVDDGYGIFGQVISKAITVTECEIVCGLIECPTIEINGPDDVSAGDVVTLVATVMGGMVDSVEYTWTIQSGEIVEGQGSPSIKVRIPEGILDTTINLSVTLHGAAAKGSCLTEASRVYKHGPF